MISVHEIGGSDTTEGKFVCEIVVAELKSLGIQAVYTKLGDELLFGDKTIGMHVNKIGDGYSIEISPYFCEEYVGIREIPESRLNKWVGDSLKYLISIGAIAKV